MIYQNKKAFTLIETLISLGIFLILMSGATWFIIAGNRNVSVMWEQLVTQNQGKKSIDHIINYVRKAEVSSIGAYALELVDPYELVFYANVDNDPVIEKVRFWLDSTIFKQTITELDEVSREYTGAEKTTVLAESMMNLQVGHPLFLYYDENYTGTEDYLTYPFYITNVRMIKVQLELEKDPTKSPEPLHVESMALVRSLR
ncbi:MAG: prepilin-type N-terminal cleavage/methylation domain-containing protein [Candidatus Magasanikbacteria bacterium]